MRLKIHLLNVTVFILMFVHLPVLAKWHEKTFHVMGTEARVQLWQQDKLDAELLIQAVIDEMNRIDIEISRLQAIIEKSTILEIPKPGTYDKIIPGVTVELENFFVDKIVTYTILGESESNPSLGSISFKSPLGKELLGLGVGDVAELIRGDDVIEYEVLKIYVK